jgi:hypothetical protein|tara:strand:- start:212 stop:880 length:669 start_codon:yes stop_codon:yes gene_type:complete
MKLLASRETVKLFYDEYSYKLVVVNALVHIFREKNLRIAQVALTALQQQYDQGEPLRQGQYSLKKPIELSTFIEAKNLYTEFYKQEDYKLRVSGPRMQIYSHDISWLKMLGNKFNGALELWEPNKENISKLHKNIIFVDHPVEYEYKITLGYSCDSGLAAWIRNNPGKAKAGDVCLSAIESNGYIRGMYFYARDDKIIQLLSLFVGKLARIDKLVYNTTNDK